ncbi:MAG: hypothetical protein RIS45_497 [Planctomycetota bacterium]
MKSQPTPSIDDSLLAVAERQSDQWRVLLARRGDQTTVLEARTFASDAAIASWLTEQRCGDLRMVLPAHTTIVRSVTIPVASQGQMLAALRLQAEGMFLGSVPLVRIGLGVLDGGSESERQGVIMAWPESQSGSAPSAKLEAITRYVPEPAAMLVLASGDRPAISADRSVGSIAIAMRSPSKGSLEIRATRETAASDIDGDAPWNEGLRRALVETALNAGMEPAQIGAFVSGVEASTERSGDRVLMLDPNLAEILGAKLDVRVSAASDGAEWWREWAIPLAALVVACGPLADLAKLRRAEERVAPSRTERFVQRYSKPSRALLVSCVAIGIVGVAPIASAWLRMKALEWKMPQEPSAFEAAQRKVDQRIALYSELSKRTLPVAKILGDLACCTPDGIEIEQIQLSSTQGVTIRGVAKAQGERSAAEIVNTMARLMDSSGIFDKTHWRWNMPDGRGIFKFDLDALIVRPNKSGSFKDHDWSVKSLVQVKYPQADSASGDGTGASESSEPTTVAQAPETTPPAEAPRRNEPARPASTPSNAAAAAKPEGTNDGTAPAGATASRGIGRRETPPAGDNANPTPTTNPPADGGATTQPASAASGAGAGGGPSATARVNTRVPDPFTDEELGAMSKEQARGLLSEVSRARRREDLDAETRKRLSDDFNRILEHLKQ